MCAYSVRIRCIFVHIHVRICAYPVCIRCVFLCTCICHECVYGPLHPRPLQASNQALGQNGESQWPPPSNPLKSYNPVVPSVKSVKTVRPGCPPRQIRQSGETARQNHHPSVSPTTPVRTSSCVLGFFPTRLRSFRSHPSEVYIID